MEAAGLISNGEEEDATFDFNITFEDNAIEDLDKLLKEGFALEPTGPANFSYELGEITPSAERNQPVLNEQANDPCMNLAVSPDVDEEFLKFLGEDGSNHKQESTQPSAGEIQGNDVSIIDLPNSSQFMNFGGASSSTIQTNPSVGAIQPYLPNKENRQSIATEMQGNGETQQNWMNLNPTLGETQIIISGITGDSVLSTVDTSQFMNFGQSSSTSPSMGATQPCSLSGEQGDPGFSAGGNQSQLVKQTISAERPGQSVYSTLPESLQGNSANVGQPGQPFFGPVSTHQTMYPSMKNGVVQLEHEANWMKQQNQINGHLQNAYQIEFNLPQQMAPTTQVAVGSSTVYADQFMQNIASNNMMGGTSSSNIYGQPPLYSSSYSQTPSLGIVDGTTSSYGINVLLQQQQQQPSWALLNQNVPYVPWTPAPSRPSMHNQYAGGNNVFELQNGSSMFSAGAGRPSMHFRPQTLTNQLQLHNKVPFPEFTDPYDSQYHNYSIPHSGVGHYVHPRPTFNQFTYASNNAHDYDPRSYNSMLTEPSLSTRIPRQFSNHHQQQVPPRKDIFRPYNSVLSGQAGASSSSSSSRRQNSTAVQASPESLPNLYSKKKYSFTRVLAGKFMANQASDAPNLSKAQLENYRPPSLGMRSKGLEELLPRPVIRSAPNPILDSLENTLNCTSDSEQPETGEKNKEASVQAASERSESSDEPSKESKKKKKVLECHGRSKKNRFEFVDPSSASSAKSSKNYDTPQKKSRTGERDHQPAGASTSLEQFMNKNSGKNQVTAASGAPQVTKSNRPSTENLVYNPLFESHGLPADPHLRLFASRRDC